MGDTTVKIKSIQVGKFYKTTVGVGVALDVARRFPPSVKFEIKHPQPRGIHYIPPREIFAEVPDPAQTPAPKPSSIERTTPIKIELGFAIRALMVADGLEFAAPFPSAEALCEMTKRHPDIIPAPGWTLGQCKRALANPTALGNTTGDGAP